MIRNKPNDPAKALTRARGRLLGRIGANEVACPEERAEAFAKMA